MALISVIIPCYNAEAFLADAVRSVQAQTHTDFECLLVDDGSGDGTRALIERLAREDSRLRPIILPRNQGVSAARNAALDAARGEWVALLDADDLWEPDRLKKLVSLAEEMSADMVADNVILTAFPSGRPLELAMRSSALNGTWWTLERYMVHCVGGAVFAPASILQPLMRRAFLEERKIRYDANFRSSEDFLFYFTALFEGARFITTQYAGYIVRMRHGSITRSGLWARKESIAVCDWLLAVYDSQISAISKGLLRNRKERLVRSVVLIEAFNCARSGKLGSSVGLILRNCQSLALIPPLLYKVSLSLVRRVIYRVR